MTSKSKVIGACLAFALSGAAGPVSATRNDCDAIPPRAEVPGSPGDATSDNDLARDTLTEKLATCGSVLTPPPLGDADIIAPAPSVGDDIAIHPDAPAARP